MTRITAGLCDYAVVVHLRLPDRYESSRGIKIYGSKPNQTGNMVAGEKKRGKVTEGNRQKKVANGEYHRQEWTQKQQTNESHKEQKHN